jgi:hypothetical protein
VIEGALPETAIWGLRVQVMVVLVEVEQSQADPVADTKVSPLGSGSLTVYVPFDAAVPALDTVMV